MVREWEPTALRDPTSPLAPASVRPSSGPWTPSSPGVEGRRCQLPSCYQGQGQDRGLYRERNLLIATGQGQAQASTLCPDKSQDAL